MSWPAAGGEWPVLAPPGEAAVDEARVARAADVGPDAEPLGDAGPEHLEHHVGRVGEAQERVDAVGMLEVEADRRLADRCMGLPWPDGTGRSRATSARSTRSTSAPRSASSIPQNGPGPRPTSSTTRNPAIGPRQSWRLGHGVLRSRRFEYLAEPR